MTKPELIEGKRCIDCDFSIDFIDSVSGQKSDEYVVCNWHNQASMPPLAHWWLKSRSLLQTNKGCAERCAVFSHAKIEEITND